MLAATGGFQEERPGAVAGRAYGQMGVSEVGLKPETEPRAGTSWGDPGWGTGAGLEPKAADGI